MHAVLMRKMMTVFLNSYNYIRGLKKLFSSILSEKMQCF